jgi:hypothetical protein
VFFVLRLAVNVAKLTTGPPSTGYNYTTIALILNMKIPLNSAIKYLSNAAIDIEIGQNLIENEDYGEGTFSQKTRSSNVFPKNAIFERCDLYHSGPFSPRLFSVNTSFISSIQP